jgi:competence protein ComEC
MTIKHITQSRAEQLMTLRPFSSIQDMKRISGIGDARIADIIEQGVAYME